MPGENIQDWSITAADNGNSDSLINWLEGQPRASVNNSARSMMAAHAKNRNLQNGSITTGGTANAQTFTSGIDYSATVVPTGLFVRLKIGISNTAAITLNMDGIGAVAVKDQGGNDLGIGALTIGQFAEFIYDGTNWVLLTQSSTSVVTTPQCGRLAYVSATALSFLPFNGDQIKINGVIYPIPSAGIVGLANTGIFKEGVAASSLTASTLYYVYAFLNSSVITADFSTTGHATSTTAGNVGVEVKSGDNSRTLIGMVFINPSGQFRYANDFKGVASWFNRRNVSFYGGPSTAAFGNSVANEVDASMRSYFLNWGEEAVHAYLEGVANMNAAGFLVNYGIRIDGTLSTVYQSAFQAFGDGTYGDTQQSAVFAPAEGSHFIALYAWVNGGVATFFNAGISGMTRG